MIKGQNIVRKCFSVGQEGVTEYLMSIKMMLILCSVHERRPLRMFSTKVAYLDWQHDLE